jgi:predicted deacylase
MRLSIVLITILASISACQSSASPTFVPPTPSPAVAVAFQPTTPPRPIPTALILPPTLQPTRIPPPTSESDPRTLIGYSALGAPIYAHHVGVGARTLLLVGGMHGGYEINTVALIDALLAHFTANPAELPASTSLTLIRALNPDGLAYPGRAEGRFNANGVDLNRNWGCGWQSEAFWRGQRVSAGESPLSEPETRALADYILQSRPSAVLFFHSAAGGVFAGDCQTARIGRESASSALSAVVGAAAGYTHGSPFSAYPVTGTAPSWVDGLGIPAADVELISRDSPEFERNLAAVRAALAWLTAQR